jgi:hypothetical protein
MRATPWIGIVCFALCVTVGVAADQTITGAVVDADNGEPIRHARVAAFIWKDREFQHRDVLSVLTGDAGGFNFSGLPAGKWEIHAQKTGYLGEGLQTYSKDSIDVGVNSAPAPITLRLIALGTLSVSVVDNRGFPVTGAEIQIGSVTGRNAPFSSAGQVGAEGTDRALLPRGSYRIAALAAGPGSLLLAKGLTFAPVYYPGTADINHAELVDVQPGKERHINLAVTPIPSREIRGRMEVAGRITDIYVLTAGTVNPLLTRGSTQPDRLSRGFRIAGLSPGSYLLVLSVCSDAMCSSGGRYSRKIEIVDADVTGLVITDADRSPG